MRRLLVLAIILLVGNVLAWQPVQAQEEVWFMGTPYENTISFPARDQWEELEIDIPPQPYPVQVYIVQSLAGGSVFYPMRSSLNPPWDNTSIPVSGNGDLYCLSNNSQSSACTQLEITRVTSFVPSFWITSRQNDAWRVRFRYGELDHGAGEFGVRIWPVMFGIPPTDANFTADPTSGPAPLVVEFTDTSTGPVTTWDWYIDEVHFSDQQHPDYIFSEPGTYDVKLVVNEGQSNESEHEDTITVVEPIEMVRPLTAADEGANASYVDQQEFLTLVEGYSAANSAFVSNLSPTSVVGFAGKNSVVYAADDGVVTSISPLTSANCYIYDNECYVVFHDLVFEDGEPRFVSFSFNLNSVFEVTIQVEPNRYLKYLVTNPHEYITIGDNIGKGCPLGDTIKLTPRIAGAGGPAQPQIEFLTGWLENVDGQQLTSLFPQPNAEFTVVQQIIEISGQLHLVPILPHLVDYPEDEPRSCEYTPSACISADPELKRPDLWYAQGTPEWSSGGGVVLQPGSSISMQLSLDSQAEYMVDVWARTMGGGSGQFAVQVGQTYQTFPIADPQYRQFITPATTHAADIGLFYTFLITNTGNVPIFVSSACIRDDETGGLRPQTCYFQNPSFDGLPAAQGWDTTGTVNSGNIHGEIVMWDGDTISQNAMLLPDGVNPHIYILKVTTTVGGADIDTLKSDSTSTVGFEWQYPATESFSAMFGPESENLYPVSGFFQGIENGITFLPNNEIVFYAEVSVANAENSDFTIRAVINSANPDLFVRVREVCIDDPFDHHDDPDAYIPQPPPFQVNCTGVSPPQDDFIGSWIFYLWAQLDKFFQCDLMVMLNRMHDTATKMYALIGWGMRWSQSAAITAANWLGTDLLLWLNGHFSNMAVGQVTVIENNPGASLWDVLLALINVVLGPVLDMLQQILTTVLGIVNQAVSLIFTIIEGVVTLVLEMLIQGVNLLSLAQQLLGAIVTAYNESEPVTLPGLADCSANPQATAWCIAMWVLENTIFSGPGSAIIPILTGVLSIHLILWVVGELKKTVLQIGQSA